MFELFIRVKFILYYRGKTKWEFLLLSLKIFSDYGVVI